MPDDLTDADVLEIVARRRRRGCLIAGLVLLALIALTVVAWLMVNGYWKRRFTAKLDEIRAAGEPATWEEVLAARPNIPDEENAAVLYLKAVDALAAADTPAPALLLFDWEMQPPMGVRRSDQVQRIAEECIAAAAEPLSMIRAAGRLGQAAYPADSILEPWDPAGPGYLDDLSRAAGMCCMYAELLAGLSRPHEAALDIEAVCAMANSLARQTDHHAARIAFDVYAMAEAALERTLALAELAPDDLQALDACFETAEGIPIARNWLAGQRAAAVSLVMAAPGGWLVESNLQGRIELALYRGVPGRRWHDGLHFLEAAGDFRSILDSPLPSQPPLRFRLDDAASAAYEERPRRLISASEVTLYGPILQKALAHRGMLRAVRAALAIELWRMERGRWPASLQEMAGGPLPDVLIDPISGGPMGFGRDEPEPLRCLRLAWMSVGLQPPSEAGLSVYSVGDDGRPGAGDSDSRYWDGAWRLVPRPDSAFCLLNPRLRGARARTFREEVLDAYDLLQLRNRGLTAEKLKAMGLTDEDLRSLGFGP